jgi:hypothetical protein
MAAALGLAFFGARGGWIAVVEGAPRTQLPRCARPGRCARLGLLRRACELDCRYRGRPRTLIPRSARPGRCTCFFLRLLRAGVLCCVAVGGDLMNPPFSAVIGMANALGLAFFGLGCRSRGDSRTHHLRCARPGRCTWLSSAPSVRGRAVFGGDSMNLPTLCAWPGRCARLGLLRRAWELDGRSRVRPQNFPSSLRSAWPTDPAWPSSACVRAGLPYSGNTPEPALLRCARPGRCARLGLLQRASELYCRTRVRPPIIHFSAALGLVAALSLAYFGVRASWIVVIGRDPRKSLLRCARPGRSTSLSSARGRAVLFRIRGDFMNPPFSAVIGMAAALGLAFFGLRASWLAVVGENPRPPPSPLRLAFFVFVGVLRSFVVRRGTLPKRTGHHLPEPKKCVGKTKGYHTIKWQGQTLSGAAYALMPRTHALLTADWAFRWRFVNDPIVLSTLQ